MATGGYPSFSDRELRRRHEALAEVMDAHGVEHVLVRGANRVGTAVGWLTRWPVTQQAVVVVTPGRPDALLVGFYNHVPNAVRIATGCDVRWVGERPLETALDEVRARGGGRLGFIGPPVPDAVDLNGEYARLRLVKSAEEIEWIRRAAALTDAGVAALREAARPGVDERALCAAIEAAYLPAGAVNHIHYLAATPMAAPEICVPAQYPSDRPLAAGDALVCEVSAAFWEYPAQLLRTFAVAAEPAPLYAELHAVADAAFDAIAARLRPGATAADLAAAGGVIVDAGFAIRDDLVHGFVGGYLPPVIGARTAVPDFTFAAGMTVVVQPNVVTPDERAGVQTGELLLVGEDGAERLHGFERGLLAA
ncbi:MAG TPA: M24 family metallopeptidase [Solirubrobacteraceae bacterium]